MLACDLSARKHVFYGPSPVAQPGELPADYDFRSTGCSHPVRDQGHCGSCWAFGAAGALADRFCSVRGELSDLSPQYMVSCDNTNYGCQGGYLDSA